MENVKREENKDAIKENRNLTPQDIENGFYTLAIDLIACYYVDEIDGTIVCKKIKGRQGKIIH